MKLEHPEKFNIEIAEKVLEQVLREPQSHNQSLPFLFREETLCGSVGCIMGWASFFTHGYSDGDDSPFWNALADGDHLLGLTRDEFGEIYGDMDRDSAIATLKDFIAQAKEAQASQVDIDPLAEQLTAVEELVNA